MDLVDLAVAVAVAIAATGLLVTLVEGIVSRRRTYAALVATGVPRATIGTSIAWQVLAPVVPAVLVALGVGYAIGRLLTGDLSPGARRSDVPLEQLALQGAGATAAVLAVVGLGVLFLRSNTALEELRAT